MRPGDEPGRFVEKTYVDSRSVCLTEVEHTDRRSTPKELGSKLSS